jgi:hypothetical protein
MPAVEVYVSACIDVRGRRRIMLRGGNRGVAADVAGWFQLSYGGLKGIGSRFSGHADGIV